MMVDGHGSGEVEAGEPGPSAADRDHAGDARDDAASGRDLASDRRDMAGEQRDAAGDERDTIGALRDVVGGERDVAADQRDQDAERSEELVGAGSSPDDLDRSLLARQRAAYDRSQASQDRRAGASERLQAEVDRSTALADRAAGASERAHAGLDRGMALADRGASAREREYAALDDLTGAYLRGAGLVELEREMTRARRTDQPLALAFVDVDNLKAINDSRGHASGDQILLEVADVLRSKLRSYDLVIRYGGDEFVCVISGLRMADANARFSLINPALAEGPGHGSVTVGVAEMLRDETSADLVARADADLYRTRRHQRRTVV
jgi:diguanylate cyclase (GGDEF)-like protein